MPRDESFYAHCRQCLEGGRQYRGHDVRILRDGVQIVVICRMCGSTVARAALTQSLTTECMLCKEGKTHAH